MYTFICFTDFVPDKLTQYYVGYVSCGLIVAHLAVNLGIMGFSSGRILKLKIKRQYIIFQRWWKKKFSIKVAKKTMQNDKKIKLKSSRKPIVQIEEQGMKNLEKSLERNNDPYSV